MILSQDGNISIITQEKATIIELVKKIQALYPKFKNNNIIVSLTSLKPISETGIDLHFIVAFFAFIASIVAFILVNKMVKRRGIKFSNKQ